MAPFAPAATSIYIYLYLPNVYLYIVSIYRSIYSCVSLVLYLSFCFSLSLSACLSIYRFIHTYPYVCLSVCRSNNLPIFPSFSLYFILSSFGLCLFISFVVSIYLYPYLCLCLHTCVFSDLTI